MASGRRRGSERDDRISITTATPLYLPAPVAALRRSAVSLTGVCPSETLG
jgi:hypothetical protein